jgi:hypothetical protein
MAQIIDGRKYRLPNGQTVTAKQTGEGFLLEFRRKSATPIFVDSMGLLVQKGEAMRLTVDYLVEEIGEDQAALAAGVEEYVMMVLAVQQCGGEAWETMQGAIRGLYGQAMLTVEPPQGGRPEGK